MKKKTIGLLIGVIVFVVLIVVFMFVKGKSKNLSAYDICGTYKLEKSEKGEKEIDYSGINFYYCFYEDGTGEIDFDTIISSFKYEVESNDKQCCLKIYGDNDICNQYELEIEEDKLIINSSGGERLYLVKSENYIPMINADDSKDKIEDEDVTEEEMKEFIENEEEILEEIENDVEVKDVEILE